MKRAPATADAVVIGCGVIGASVAFHLALAGLRPVVCERADLAAGSSGACDGLVFLQSKKPGLHLHLALESQRRLEALRAMVPLDYEYLRCGGLVAIGDEAEHEAMRRYVAAQRDSGLDVRLVNGPEARRLEPALSEAVIAAAYSPLDAQINPMRLTLALAAGARQRGARIMPRTAVTGFECQAGAICAVATTRGTIRTRTVVLATGADTPRLAALLGLDPPIRPRRGQLLVTAPQRQILRHCLISARYIAVKYDPALAARSGQSVSMEQTARGNLLLGSTREFAGYDRNTTVDGIQAIAAACTHIVPVLKQVQVIRAFAGLRPWTPDGLPLLGPVPAVPGLVLAAGHEGDGIALSAVTGALIAELIVNGRPRIDLNDFDPMRFSAPASAEAAANGVSP
ncbi:MAG TPA: FAD-binding oxidoreductase [Desulfobacteraceae bacterium]|nr:FAD-binding oxidoreductase [Deltaproteobacteria bacterium]MBW2356906.1 FAD-binding oxidoreductase [Deltaproteobacteria bacterium]HDI59283.1 FAD-binding oxidoreductase [Desulfobacteraceae bacterium]